MVGTSLVVVTDEFAAELEPGDMVVGVASTGALRRIPRAVADLVDVAVERSIAAFSRLAMAGTHDVTAFFEAAARRLADDALFTAIARANERDVADAAKRGRSTTRLVLDDRMRSSMVEAFGLWAAWREPAHQLLSSVEHEGWRVEQWRSPLGPVGFVFEGRPNVFADATGVLRTGNTVVFRIGSDALGTALALMEHVIHPSLDDAGLDRDTVILLPSREHAAGWALFSNPGLALAVARGSGEAVAELGSMARQAGVPVSLHGTGGAWLMVGESADPGHLRAVVEHSLDRKVCNTLNTVVIERAAAADLFPVVVEAADAAAAKRGRRARVHCVGEAMDLVGTNSVIEVARPGAESLEKQFTPMDPGRLDKEFEWEINPEFSIVVVASLEEGVELFNRWSPRFVVSTCSRSSDDHELVWSRCDAPFVGDGFTRWVDGQFALLRPELGLSNWEHGRLLARGGVLSGDSIHTIRLRMHQADPDLQR